MSDTLAPDLPDPADRPLEPALAPLALWTAASIGLLFLSVAGPKLWATQATDNATIALEILAVGQVLIAAVIWPLWTRSLASAIGVIASGPAWLLLAGRIALSPTEQTLDVGWKLLAALAALGLIRLTSPRHATGVVWALILAGALGAPVLWMLHRGG